MAFFETYRLPPDELVRAGQAVRVRLSAYDRNALAAAARELARHVRIAALAGWFLPMEEGPAPATDAAGLYRYSGTGYTWRAAGAEYTARELAHALASVYARAGGRGSMAVDVDALSGVGSTVLGGFDSLDLRGGGAADRAVDTGGRVVEGVVGTVEGVSSAAEGIGGAAAGFGEGAAAFGGLAKDWPVVTFVVLTGLALAFAWRKS